MVNETEPRKVTFLDTEGIQEEADVYYVNSYGVIIFDDEGDRRRTLIPWHRVLELNYSLDDSNFRLDDES